MVVSDNNVLSDVEGGTDLTSHAVLAWCQDTVVEWHHNAPGKPQQTASSKALTVACATRV